MDNHGQYMEQLVPHLLEHLELALALYVYLSQPLIYIHTECVEFECIHLQKNLKRFIECFC